MLITCFSTSYLAHIAITFNRELSKMGNLENKKPHAVLIPTPFQGHINPLFKLAKLLHLRGFHITFVNTEYNHKRLLKSRGPNALDGIPGFNFETIPDGLTPIEGDGDVSQDIPSLAQSIRKNFLKPFCELLTRLNHSANVPPVTCLVSDYFMSFAIQASKEFAIPNVILFPASASFLLSLHHLRSFVEKGLTPLKGTKLSFFSSQSMYVCVYIYIYIYILERLILTLIHH